VVLSHVDRIVERVLAPLQAIATNEAPAAARLREMLVLRVMFRFDAVQHYTESISEVLRDLRAPLLERRERYFEQEAKRREVELAASRIADLVLEGLMTR